jgi:flavin reductase (DIM6/NTAB) family NADH-FMN oxidoreductase RutF
MHAASVHTEQLMAPTPCDSGVFRRTIGHFATGVTVITTRTGDQAFGMTASAVSSLSLDPPMLVACVNRNAPTHDAITCSAQFVVNVLALSQEPLARHFATPSDDKFAGVQLTEGRHGMPVLAGCVANFECAVESVTVGGTHTIFVARVLSALAEQDRDPLLYYCGEFGRLLRAQPLPQPVVGAGAQRDWAAEMFCAV